LKALIIGVTGQDGAYLARSLLDKGYEVYGTYRRLSTPNFWRLQYLDILPQVKLIPADLIDSASLADAVKTAMPDIVVNLAAQSFVGASFEQPIGSGEITGLGLTRILEAVRLVKPDARVCQASSSELFGLNGKIGTTQNEETPFKPSSPYAVAKLYAYWTARVYRDSYGMFVSNSLAYNHESQIRGLEFVTRKVTNSAARIKLGLQKSLRLGNMEAKRDWGYAPEFVEAMLLMLKQNKPGDYVIATGETHSVRELCDLAFKCVNLDYSDYVIMDTRYTRPVDVQGLCGDSSRAKRELGWEPRVKFKELVELMLVTDLSRWERWKTGEQFPWDARNYTEDVDIVSRMQYRGG
jgi:GDPmannose 4,6-dehydratase